MNTDHITYIVGTQLNNDAISRDHVTVLGSYQSIEEATNAIDRHTRILLRNQGASISLYSVPLEQFLTKRIEANSEEAKDLEKLFQADDRRLEMLSIVDEEQGHPRLRKSLEDSIRDEVEKHMRIPSVLFIAQPLDEDEKGKKYDDIKDVQGDKDDDVVNIPPPIQQRYYFRC